ncbi:MAG TPA: hypothetical protein VFG50_14130 [Rhodothermales bacterium]|nr:hypothetical protein [Rhodothermales bacterium]
MSDVLQNLVRAAAMAMGLLYVVIGVALIFYPVEFFGLGMGLRIGLGILLILYGAYRVYRGTKKTLGNV